MQLLGLILLLASSWYLWKLTSNFLDEPTKKELTNIFNNLKNKFSEGKQNFSKEKISESWEKYKLITPDTKRINQILVILFKSQ